MEEERVEDRLWAAILRQADLMVGDMIDLRYKTMQSPLDAVLAHVRATYEEIRFEREGGLRRSPRRGGI